MLKLADLEEKFLDKHSGEMDKIFTTVQSSDEFQKNLLQLPVDGSDVVSFFHTNRRTLYRGRPEKLLAVHNQFRARFPKYAAYFYARPRNGTSGFEASVDTLYQAIASLFDYGKFSAKEAKWNAYHFINSHKNRICPYCHLNHLNFHFEKVGDEFSMRAPLDHFYPRSRYPYLAVSAYNLIPSCTQCNSSLKSDADPLSDGVPNPFCKGSYADDLVYEFEARPQVPPAYLEFHSQIEIRFLSKSQPTELWERLFKLNARYGWYTPEIFEVFRRSVQWQDNRLDWAPNIPADEFLLGFDPREIERRPLGMCLKDVITSLLRDL